MTIERLGLFRALGDHNRLRAVLVLRASELTVSELRTVLQLAQSTVSTLLKALMEVDVVAVRREGRRAYYRSVSSPLVTSMLGGIAMDPTDKDSLASVLAARGAQGDSGLAAGFETAEVAGRSWQSLSCGLLLLSDLGVVADFGVGSGHLSLLLAERARRLYAVDHDPGLLESLAQRASSRALNVSTIQADLSTAVLPELVDLVVLSLVLCTSSAPEHVMNQAASCLKPGGRMWVTALAEHDHDSIRDRLGHSRSGISRKELRSWASRSELTNIQLMSGGRERRAPRLESLVMVACKSEEK